MVGVTADTKEFERGMMRVASHLNRWAQAMHKASRATKAFGGRVNLFVNGRHDRKRVASNYLWPGKRRFQP